MEFDVRIRKLDKIERIKEDEIVQIQRLLARDEDGVNQIMITTAEGFAGFKPGQTVKVTVKNPQKTLVE